MTFEVTVERLDEAVVAEKYGARRVEVCTALDLGGLTPSMGLVKSCLENLEETEVHVLIRPRPGGFVYTKEETMIMLSDIQTFSEMGVSGVVFGFLKKDNSLDVELTAALCRYAKKVGLEVTFHRAIDYCTNLKTAIEQLIDMGVDRVLTSGQSPTARQGLSMIVKIHAMSKGKMEVMAGSGVNVKNAKEIYASGIDALHFSIRNTAKFEPGMGDNSTIDEEKIQEISKIIDS